MTLSSLDVITVVKNPGEEFHLTSLSIWNLQRSGKCEIRWIIIDGSEKTAEPVRHELDQNWNEVKIQYVNEPDTGIYSAMNKGLNLVQSDYFIFLNSGDMIKEGILEVLGTTRHKIFCGQTEWHNQTGEIDPKLKTRPARHFLAVMPNHQGMVFPREFRDVKYDESLKISSDQALKLDFWKKGHLEFSKTLISSCLLGGISMRKLSIIEILGRYKESSAVINQYYRGLHSKLLKILYLGRYLQRWNWKKIN
jgi:putative colanic acid biosynthesis glycosyltransferase